MGIQQKSLKDDCNLENYELYKLIYKLRMFQKGEKVRLPRL